MNQENENLLFLKALSQLPLIRKNIIKISEKIISNSNTRNQEKKLVEKAISELMNEMKNNGINVSTEDNDMLKYGIEMLITSQLPSSKIAAKIRTLKGNVPDFDF